MTAGSSSSTRSRCCSKKCIRVESCENGDTVLVVWNEVLRRYIVAQDSQYLHFLAEDSHPLFSLPVPSTKDVIFENIQKPTYFLGIVTDKQYCVVKKEGTRYRVPIGTKFCRIRMRPLSPVAKHGSSSDLSRRNGSLPETRCGAADFKPPLLSQSIGFPRAPSTCP